MLASKLKIYPKKRITLEELYTLCGNASALREEIYILMQRGILKPVKSSGTDGNLTMPLYKKYHIITEKTDTAVLRSEIRHLHPRLLANGYLLKHPSLYQKYAHVLHMLSVWLSSPKDDTMLSRRERSFAIFGEEKLLDTHSTFMESIGMTADTLGYYVTPEQCFADYIPRRCDDMTLLICENKDIWFNIRRLMYENGCTELFGTHIDGVVFGQGNDVTGAGKFAAYAGFLGAARLHFLYCGDIDRAGFDIFLRLQEQCGEVDISLFIPLYCKMLELCNPEKLPPSEDHRERIPDMDTVYPLFPPEYTAMLRSILAENRRLPQEIINYRILSENMR